MKRTSLIIVIVFSTLLVRPAYSNGDDRLSPGGTDGVTLSSNQKSAQEKGFYSMLGGGYMGGVLNAGWNVGGGLTLFAQWEFADGWSYSDDSKYGIGLSYEIKSLGKTVRPFFEAATGSDFNSSPRFYYPQDIELEPGESLASTYTYFAAGLRLYLGKNFYFFGGVVQTYTKTVQPSYNYSYDRGKYTSYFDIRPVREGQSGAYFGMAITGI